MDEKGAMSMSPVSSIDRPAFTGRTRSPKASERQKEEIIKFFEDNPTALRVLNGTNNNAKQKIWIELTHKLNSLDGALKTTSKWAKYWNDIIIYTKSRAKTFISGECRDRPPTEIEQRILTLIGHLSFLKTWQRIWESGIENQAKHSAALKNELESQCIESIDTHSQHSDTDDLEIQEYKTMVIDAEEPTASNIHAITFVHNINNSDELSNSVYKSNVKNLYSKDDSPTHEVLHENEMNHDESFGNPSFIEELAENVRTLGSSFNTIGMTLQNIAMLLERLNQK